MSKPPSPHHLTAEHAAQLRASGIEEHEARAAGIRSVDAEEASELLGMAVRSDGFVIPYPGTDVLQIRLDVEHVLADGRAAKYLSPRGSPNHLYVPRGALEELRADPFRPLYLIEGAKKALCARLRLRVTCAAVSGCWGWRSKDPGPVVPELVELLPLLRDRRVVLVFDSDARTNLHVARAAHALATWLRHEARACPLWAFPPVADRGKVGLDDLFVHGGADAVLVVLNSASEPVEPASFLFRERIAACPRRDPGTAFVGTQLASELVDLLAAAPTTARAALADEARARLQLTAAERTALLADSRCAAQAASPVATKDALPGRALAFAPVEPWPEPVEGADLLEELAAHFRAYAVLPAHGDTTLALWALHTFAHEYFETSPYLAVTSPVKRCGKSRVLDLLHPVVRRPLRTGSATSAVVFRSIEQHGPTLLMDEADTYLPGNEGLRGILNTAHTRSGAIVSRAAGEDHQPRIFSTWAPIALAAIGSPDDTIRDRSIVLTLRRRRADEPVQRLRTAQVERTCAPLRRRAARWVADHAEPLREDDAEVPMALDDRAADGWHPLLVIADLVGGAWPERARAAAVALSAPRRDEGDDVLGVALLRDVRTAIGTSDRVASGELVRRLVSMEGRPWAECGRQERPLSVHALSRLLRPFGIVPGTIRLPDGTTPKGYYRRDFAEAWERYCPAELVARTATPPQASFPLHTNAGEPPPQAPRVATGKVPSDPTTTSDAALWRFEAEDPDHAFEERASIREYDGGLSRHAAEQAARGEVEGRRLNGTAVRP